MPEIRVIVPVYRAEAYLHACIDSILSQTFSGFELILVDDGSPDNCGAICDDYAARDSRVRVIHQENQGQAAARNHALAAAKGDWVCFVDSDDAVHPQMLERLRQAAAGSGAAMSMCRMLEAPEIPGDGPGGGRLCHRRHRRPGGESPDLRPVPGTEHSGECGG